MGVNHWVLKDEFSIIISHILFFAEYNGCLFCSVSKFSPLFLNHGDFPSIYTLYFLHDPSVSESDINLAISSTCFAGEVSFSASLFACSGMISVMLLHSN